MRVSIFPSFYLHNNSVCFIFHAYSMATPGKLDPSFESVRVKVSYLMSTLYIRLEWFFNYRGSCRQRYCSCLTKQMSQNTVFLSSLYFVVSSRLCNFLNFEISRISKDNILIHHYTKFYLLHSIISLIPIMFQLGLLCCRAFFIGYFL